MESGNVNQFSTLNELVKFLLGDDYYDLSLNDKKKRLSFNAAFNGISDTSYLYDEIAYIYLLLINNRITLFEKVTSDIFISSLDKSNFSEDYIVINKFAGFLLKRYVGDNHEI